MTSYSNREGFQEYSNIPNSEPPAAPDLKNRSDIERDEERMERDEGGVGAPPKTLPIREERLYEWVHSPNAKGGWMLRPRQSVINDVVALIEEVGEGVSRLDDEERQAAQDLADNLRTLKAIMPLEGDQLVKQMVFRYESSLIRAALGQWELYQLYEEQPTRDWMEVEWVQTKMENTRKAADAAAFYRHVMDQHPETPLAMNDGNHSKKSVYRYLAAGAKRAMDGSQRPVSAAVNDTARQSADRMLLKVI